ncbi:MAG: primosomal protein N' [Eubacteriales bacterium]|nr:primosomal protein N' [Eubacteriales bacterium]
MRIAKVYLLDALFHIDREYDYAAGEGISPKVGNIVTVPFGKGNRRMLGIVSCTYESTDKETESEISGSEATLKSIYSVHPSEYSLDADAMELARMISKLTVCTFGEAARLMLPSAVLSVSHLPSAKYKKYVSVSNGIDTGAAKSPLQRAIIDFLSENGECELEYLCDALGIDKVRIKPLCERGVITVRKEEKIANTYEKYGKGKPSKIILNREQTDAHDKAKELMSSGKPCAALLFGVTGSGKTKVIMSLIDDALAMGKTAVMLVPEISLTPQTVSLFCERYGERVAVIHSSLSAGERLDSWRRIKRGEVDLVIGTRSAIFAPLKNIGIIIIDEEHEHTYKSDSDPKYHTRDVASVRCKQNNALMLLASATPSVESFYRAKKGIYTLIEMKRRYGGAKLPSVHTVDMRGELSSGNVSCVSQLLYDKMCERRERREQTILLLNRRGYNPSVHCRKCGYVFECPRCSLSLTYHSENGGRGNLMCHICGYRIESPAECPECHERSLSFLGTGTQRAESELERIFPDSHVLRMDADTTASKHSYENMLDSFRRREYDILLGTQMVAKGHDFPSVSLVGVMLADSSLYVNDFRASERTFSLITQVIGRAGRGSLYGEAVIQTFRPDSEIIRLAAKQDYEAFYDIEIKQREAHLFPPFCDIVTMTVTADDEEKLKEGATRVSNSLGELAQKVKSPVIIFGPVDAQIYKAMGKYRKKIIIKTRINSEIRKMLSDMRMIFSCDKNILLTLDINPTNT